MSEKQQNDEQVSAEEAPETSNVSNNDDPVMSEDDWSNLADDVSETPRAESEPEPEVVAEAETEEPDVPDERVDPETEAPAEAAPEEPAAETKPTTEPAVEEPTQPERPPEQPQLTQETIDQMWNARRETLAKDYQLSEEEAESLLTNAEETFPRLAARIQVETEKAVWTHLNQVLPQMVGRIQQETVQRQQQEDGFYQAFPQLKDRVSRDPGAKQVVENMRQLFRQQHPNIPQPQLDAQVGAAAMVALKIPLEGSQPPVQQPAKQVPHRPAQPRQTAPVTRKPALGQIEAYAEQLVEEDAGSSVTF